MKVPFWKLQSIGNDFPLIHPSEIAEDLSLSDLAKKICDRRFGVGGDGMLTLERESAELLHLRMFNPDGTEDFCGNGIRCAAKHAWLQGWVRAEFSINHLNRTVKVSFKGDEISTELGSASYRPEDVPLESDDERFESPIFWSEQEMVVGSALSTGSTHVIVPVDQLPEDEEFFRLGPLIETFGLYPSRTSIIWREKIADAHIRIRIWERGVGETLGCGTGSSAAAVDYLRSMGGGGSIRVDSRGGTVWVSAERWDKPISILGTATAVYSGTFRYR